MDVVDADQGVGVHESQTFRCCWMLLDVVGCCWMLMDVVVCCWMLRDVVGCC